ncbi:MAG: GNAT family N-acetyltransferase [Gammaproteobacteria bacterium]
MDTDSYLIETSDQDNPALEQYLSEAITEYGINQINGETPRKLYSCLKNQHNIIVGGIMGYATLNMFFITHLFIDESIRNQGLAGRLLIDMENAGRNLGCDLLRLNTLNEKAGHLYTRAGFEETIRINNYIKGFDLVYYHKRLDT